MKNLLTQSEPKLQHRCLGAIFKIWGKSERDTIRIYRLGLKFDENTVLIPIINPLKVPIL